MAFYDCVRTLSLNNDSNNDDYIHVDHPPVTNNHPPIADASMTDDGYQLVGKGGKPYTRVLCYKE